MEIRQVKSRPGSLLTRSDSQDPVIEGYFAVFNSNYDIFPGATESIAPGAFKNTLDNDIRALVNHDTTLVLGRKKAGTLELKEDSKGLWGRIHINPKDSDAMSLYERVKRRDVTQCSFGFEIIDEDTIHLQNGDTHWTIKEINLFEVSVCTFPAYKETNIEARKKDLDIARIRNKPLTSIESATGKVRKIPRETHEEWKARMLKKYPQWEN